MLFRSLYGHLEKRPEFATSEFYKGLKARTDVDDPTFDELDRQRELLADTTQPNPEQDPNEVIELVLGPLDDLDIFVLDPSNGCSASSCVAYGDATVSWAVTAGSTWYIAIDGANGDVSPYELTITEVGTTPPPPPSTESSCTDGLDDDADGLVDCDDPGCGAANACQVGTCIPARVLSCGGTDSWNNGATGSWQLIDTYGCTSWNESGPEVTYLFTPTSAVDTPTTAGKTTTRA